MEQLIDLSHPIEDGMTTYPGLPAPRMSAHLSRADSRERYQGEAEFHIGRIDMVANTGTYIDAPFHRYADGTDVGELPLNRIANVAGLIVQLTRGERSLRIEQLRGVELRDRALLVHTGWSRHWRSDAYGNADHPFIPRETAQYLVDEGVAVVGIDSVNIDDMADPARPAHTLLLGGGIPIVEHLTNLSELDDREFTFFAVPPPMRGMGTFSVRAFALVV
jgi:kynurenine formamidase